MVTCLSSGFRETSEAKRKHALSPSSNAVGVTAAMRIESEQEWSEVGTVNIARWKKRVQTIEKKSA